MPDVSPPTMDLVEMLGAGGLGAGIVGGFWAWLSNRPKGQAAVIDAATKLQEALNMAAANQVSSLREELSRLAERIEELEGELRQEQQRSHSLEATLRRNGIDLSAAKEPGALLVIEGETATVTPPPRRRRKT